jgi:hypothetical protein
MTATNRTIESPLVAYDADDPKARRAVLLDAKRIATDRGVSVDLVQAIIGDLRAGRKKTVRPVDDFYETPADAIDLILPFLPVEAGGLVVDAGSGTGAISARVALRSQAVPIVGVEKDEALIVKARARGIYNAEFERANFLEWSPSIGIKPTLVIMNPPYSRALAFVEKGLALAGNKGVVAALLRLGWVASKSRAAFHARHRSDLYPLAKRPSFRSDGKTDASEYAWFVWGPGRGGRWMPLASKGT